LEARSWTALYGVVLVSVFLLRSSPTGC